MGKRLLKTGFSTQANNMLYRLLALPLALIAAAASAQVPDSTKDRLRELIEFPGAPISIDFSSDRLDKATAIQELKVRGKTDLATAPFDELDHLKDLYTAAGMEEEAKKVGEAITSRLKDKKLSDMTPIELRALAYFHLGERDLEAATPIVTELHSRKELGARDYAVQVYHQYGIHMSRLEATEKPEDVPKIQEEMLDQLIVWLDKAIETAKTEQERELTMAYLGFVPEVAVTMPKEFGHKLEKYSRWLVDYVKSDDRKPPETLGQALNFLTFLTALRTNSPPGEGGLLAALKEDERAAFDRLIEQLRTLPESAGKEVVAEARAHIGAVVLMMGQPERGRALMEEATKLAPENEAILMNYLHSLGTESLDVVTEVAEKAVTTLSSAKTHLFLAHVYRRADRKEAAREQVRKAHEADPKDDHARLMMACQMLARSDYKDELEQISSLLDGEPDDPRVMTMLWCARAVFLILVDETEAGKRLLQAVSRLDPNYSLAPRLLEILG